MKAWKEVRFTVEVQPWDPNRMAGFLDMMRYDTATVIEWAVSERGERRGEETYLVTLSSTRFTPDRWASFGIFPKVVA